jgi:sodium-dependent dicarboxylate transporter 2/3/5
VALVAVVILFLMPNGRGKQMLDWETAARIPWGLLLLFGGGLAIAKAFGVSGLSSALGSWLADDLQITSWPVIGMTLTLCLAITFLTEVTSNTATTTLLMPVLAAAGLAAGIDPAVLMIPAALSASCAFMLPVATAPNAIVFGTGKVSTQQMAREGLALNLIGALMITGVCAMLVG